VATSGGRTRRAILAVLTAIFLGISIWLWPDVNPSAADPSLALDARATVPAPVAATLRRACYDCHSNETRWPWYAFVPPASWLVTHDVREGRGHLNFSRWGEYNALDRADLLDEACELVTEEEMPLPQYLLLHGDARLSESERTALCDWTTAEAARLEQGGP
jgi:hypothetical protein